MDSSNDFPQNLATLLASLPDLERGLSRIHYSTCKPKEFLLLLQAYQQILSTLPPASAVHSTGLRRLLQSIEREQTEEVLSFFLRSLNEAAIAVEEKQQDKSQFYTDPTLFPVIAERKVRDARSIPHITAASDLALCPPNALSPPPLSFPPPASRSLTPGPPFPLLLCECSRPSVSRSSTCRLCSSASALSWA